MFLYSPLQLNNRTRLLAALFLAVVFHVALLPFDFFSYQVYEPGSFSRPMRVFMAPMNGPSEGLDRQPYEPVEEATPKTTALAPEPVVEVETADSFDQSMGPDSRKGIFIKAEKVKQAADIATEETMPSVPEPGTTATVSETKDLTTDMETRAEPWAKGEQPSSISRSDRDEAGLGQPATLQMAYPRYNVNTPPRYPGLARKRGVEGTVVLKVLVNLAGLVDTLAIETSSGSTLLDRAAVAAVKSWSFEPGKENGRPVKMWVRVPVVFELTTPQ